MAALLYLPFRTPFEPDFQVPLLQVKLQTNQIIPQLQTRILVLIQLTWSEESLASSDSGGLFIQLSNVGDNTQSSSRSMQCEEFLVPKLGHQLSHFLCSSQPIGSQFLIYLHNKQLHVTMAALLCLPFRTPFESDFHFPLLQVKLQTIQIVSRLDPRPNTTYMVRGITCFVGFWWSVSSAVESGR